MYQEIAELNDFYRKGKYQKASEGVNSLLKQKKLWSYRAYECLLGINKKLNEKLNIVNQEKKEFLTVVTVNFNNLVGLKRTVQSVLNQTGRNNIQFIIVDGGSNDGSKEYIQSIIEDVDIAIFGQDKGVYDGMNRGVSLANSDYTIFMNSGDCFDSLDIVSDVIDISESEDQPNFIYGAARLEGDNIWLPNIPENIWKGMICCHQSAFFNTSMVKELGGYSLGNVVVSDYQLIAKFYSIGASFFKTGLVISKIEPVGISSDFKTRTIERWKVIRSLSLKSVKLEVIDLFYRDLLSTAGDWAAPHFHSTNKAQSELISNVGKRVCFLISMPRSGSTLLQRIIDRSEDVATAGEPWFMLPLASMYDDELIDAKYGQNLNIMAKDAFINDTGLTEVIKNAQKVYADSIYSSAVKKYGKRYFLDKTPRYVHIIEKLSQIYPDAKFIVLKRNPAAVVSSYATTWYGNDYEKVVGDKLAKYDFESGFQKLADFCNSKFSNKLVINYEDLVTSPEKIASKIFSYLGVKFDGSYVNYNKNNDIQKYTFGDPTSVYSKSRPDPSHNDKWLKSLKDHKHAKNFLNTLDLIPVKSFDMLGYNLNSIKEQVTKKFNLVLPRLSDLESKFSKSDMSIQPSRSDVYGTLGVLITCFNNEHTIKDSIVSVLRQSKTADLIVVADDVSTDNSVNIVKNIINEYKSYNIQLIERIKNVGVSKNRDGAIRGMEVDFITTLDGDDMFYPGKLASEYSALKSSHVAVSFSDIIILGEQGATQIPTKAYSKINKSIMLKMVCGREAPVPRDMMFKKSLFLKADGFDVDMEIYEDWAFKMRLISAMEDQEYWEHSGSIGTIYDRRNPGLSGRKPIMHAYGQLLALARNAELIGKDAIAAGFETVAQSLNGGVKERLLKFAKLTRETSSDQIYQSKLASIWSELDWELKSKQINELIWELTANEAKPCRLIVCTPVFNAVQTIERTIRSVVRQTCDLEIHYHIQDGGSTDGTLEVIQKWKDDIENGRVKYQCKSFVFTYETKKDAGMYDALVKGFNNTTKNSSDWMTWINADDFFEENVFKLISKYNAIKKINWVMGMASVKELDGSYVSSFRPMNSAVIQRGIADGVHWDFVQQEGTFFKAKLWEKVNKNIFSSFKYAGDWYLWTQLATFSDIYISRVVHAYFCKTEGQLSEVNIDAYYNEISAVIPDYSRTESFNNFPVVNGNMHIIEHRQDRLEIIIGSVLGQFALKMK